MLYQKFKHNRTFKNFIKEFTLKYIAKRSKGEKAVAKYLKGAKIKFKEQVPLKLPHRQVFLDFQLDNGIIIEYNGKQHYEFTPYFHKSNDDFIQQVRRDEDLRNYCKINNIRLIEIPYTVLEIDKFLEKKLNE